MHDTFYFPDGRLLRTHTSPVQIRAHAGRTARRSRIIAPGRSIAAIRDMTHSPMFHQVEGLVVDENVSFANMKAVLHGFLQAFFERDLAMRLRPSLLPVHRALRRSRHVLRVLRGQGLPRLQADRLARDRRLRHGASERAARRAASIRSATPASPSAWASTASRCCATA